MLDDRVSEEFQTKKYPLLEQNNENYQEINKSNHTQSNHFFDNRR